jgi:hypothetical protein
MGFSSWSLKKYMPHVGPRGAASLKIDVPKANIACVLQPKSSKLFFPPLFCQAESGRKGFLLVEANLSAWSPPPGGCPGSESSYGVCMDSLGMTGAESIDQQKVDGHHGPIGKYYKPDNAVNIKQRS